MRVINARPNFGISKHDIADIIVHEDLPVVLTDDRVADVTTYGTDPSLPGINAVLIGLADAIKSLEKERYFRFVEVKHIDPKDWEMKCAVVKLILEQNRKHLPAEVCSGPPERWVDHVVELL